MRMNEVVEQFNTSYNNFRNKDFSITVEGITIQMMENKEKVCKMIGNCLNTILTETYATSARNILTFYGIDYPAYCPKLRKAFKEKQAYFDINKGIVIKETTKNDTPMVNNQFPNLPVIGNKDFYKSNSDFGGLYFIGQIGLSPAREELYAVKVGQAENIKRRMRSYASCAPLMWHNNLTYRIDDANERDKKEQEAHNYLASVAKGIAAGTWEWFYVDRETYFALCNNPWGIIFKEEN